jgi:hypothetical protein
MMKIMNSFSELSTVLPIFLFDAHANVRRRIRDEIELGQGQYISEECQVFDLPSIRGRSSIAGARPAMEVSLFDSISACMD